MIICAVATPGILFDWAIPLLAPTSAARSADVGVQFAALSALRECLAFADDVTLARYATVTLSACQKLLEEERTPMQLLPPLLGVLTQVSGSSLLCRPSFTVSPSYYGSCLAPCFCSPSGEVPLVFRGGNCVPLKP